MPKATKIIAVVARLPNTQKASNIGGVKVNLDVFKVGIFFELSI